MSKNDNRAERVSPKIGNESFNDIAGLRAELTDANHRQTKSREKTTGGGSGLFTMITFVIAIAAVGAAYFLWEQYQQSLYLINEADKRIANLEAQLQSTGDELNQSDAAVRIQLKELDSEVRKLWDARKKSNQQLSSNSTNLKKVVGQAAVLDKNLKPLASQVTALSAELDDIIDTFERLDIENQTKKLDEARKRLSSLQVSFGDIQKRVKENEEWLESINAFRRQVNDRLNKIQNPSAVQPVLQ